MPSAFFDLNLFSSSGLFCLVLFPRKEKWDSKDDAKKNVLPSKEKRKNKMTQNKLVWKFENIHHGGQIFFEVFRWDWKEMYWLNKQFCISTSYQKVTPFSEYFPPPPPPPSIYLSREHRLFPCRQRPVKWLHNVPTQTSQKFTKFTRVKKG